jgi:hypothetical protein
MTVTLSMMLTLTLAPSLSTIERQFSIHNFKPYYIKSAKLPHIRLEPTAELSGSQIFQSPSRLNLKEKLSLQTSEEKGKRRKDLEGRLDQMTFGMG